MQGVLCPSCGAMAPAKASECPDCGTSLFANDERTHLRARIEDIGATLHDDSEDSGPQRRTAPHQAVGPIPPPRRSASAGSPMETISDSTIPFKGGSSNGYRNGAAATI